MRDPSVTSRFRRAAIASSSSVRAHHGPWPVPALEEREHRPAEPAPRGLVAVDDRDQLHVLLAERHDPVPGAPAGVAATGDGVEAELLAEALGRPVQVLNGVDDVIDRDHRATVPHTPGPPLPTLRVMVRLRALLASLIVVLLPTVADGAAWAQTPSGSPSASPTPAPGSEGLSPATIMIGLVLIAAVLLFRTRMGRADR